MLRLKQERHQSFQDQYRWWILQRYQASVNYRTNRVPSPLGVQGFSTTRTGSQKWKIWKFPSPLGVQGFSTRIRTIRARKQHCVSVPSRGTGFFNQNAQKVTTKIIQSFRPLSGYRVFQLATYIKQLIREDMKFPSPLGVQGFSTLEKVLKSLIAMFPSPLGVQGF